MMKFKVADSKELNTVNHNSFISKIFVSDEKYGKYFTEKNGYDIFSLNLNLKTLLMVIVQYWLIILSDFDSFDIKNILLFLKSCTWSLFYFIFKV